MADLSRRWFLGGALAVTAAVTIPLVRAMPVLPVLYGDGVRDDTAALQALFDRLPVDIARDDIRLVTGERVELFGGKFRITDTIRGSGRILIENCEFIAGGNHCMFDLRGCHDSSIISNHFMAPSNLPVAMTYPVVFSS